MLNPRPWRVSGAIVVLAAAVLVGVEVPTTGFTDVETLARIYDSILDAQFDRASRELGQACPPAPQPACDLIGAVAIWWQIQLDPYSRALDATFVARVSDGIKTAESWTSREADRAEAWFYLGAAYAYRAQWRILRNDKLAAARDGKRAKDALDHALSLDKGLQDAYFGVGLYHYYAGIAPTVLRVLRWLLLLPGGDRAQGLAEMERARTRGSLIRWEADYQLHQVYLWYEHDNALALRLLEGLRARYPHNPLFLQRIAETQDAYLGDHAASLATYEALLDAARHDRVAAPRVAETVARIGIAEQLDDLLETDRAIEGLRTIVSEKPSAPAGALARAQLALGMAADRMGDRSGAVAAYRAAVAAVRDSDPQDVGPVALQRLREEPDAQAAKAYRLSLEGWRMVERGALTEADSLLGQALSINPNDPVTHFRRGKLYRARGQADLAIREFERAAQPRNLTPPTILAAAYLENGLLLVEVHQDSRAAEMFRRAIAVPGVSATTKAAASQSLRRLEGNPPSR
jgi:tetratricopeptide (TPR) repeat protein